MPNPFESKFDSECQSCQGEVYEGDLMYASEGQFICGNCAAAQEIICPKCNSVKKPAFDMCYTCKFPKQ